MSGEDNFRLPVQDATYLSALPYGKFPGNVKLAFYVHEIGPHISWRAARLQLPVPFGLESGLEHQGAWCGIVILSLSGDHCDQKEGGCQAEHQGWPNGLERESEAISFKSLRVAILKNIDLPVIYLVTMNIHLVF